MRVIFMGTPDFALAPLAEIFGRGHEIVAVYTRAPKPAGRRGLELTLSPVHAAAQKYGLKVLTPKNFREPETVQEFRAFEADVAVVVAYGLILPKDVLEATKQGCLNLHASLLPRWRGAAPIQRAIMAGDTEAGVMVMRMEEGLDTGPVLMAERVEIGRKTYGELHDELSRLGADLMARALSALERGSIAEQAQPQDGATYAKKILKDEARIDWTKSASEIDCLIRGLSPVPGAWTEAKGERLKILYAEPVSGKGAPGDVLDDALTVACGEGALAVKRVQRAGKGAMEAGELLRGFKLTRGETLG